MTFSSLKTVFRIVGGIFFISIFYVVFVLAHGTFTDFQPEAIQPIKAHQSSKITIVEQEELSFITWNIGFGGLGKESEFFFDNDGSLFFSWGKMINAPKTVVEKNINGVLDFVQKEAADFYLFQEVDVSSKRSYYHNEFEQVANKLPTFEAHFATNYQVERVPIPIMEPWRVYGKAFSGLATYGRFHTSNASRLQLPGAFDWPTRIFQLDRCIAIQRYPTTKNGELVVMNIHHSAYDEGGSLKKQQMAFLKDLLLAEYAKGNYVIVGGDWNQCPPDFPFDKFMPGQTEGYTQLNIPQDYLPEEWTWAFDPQTPTNRKTHSPYKAGTTFVTLIDFFLVSPNVEVLEAKGISQGFDFSDHQPVKLRVRLR
ncbi:MAG: endonuclease/exonuclease/phosphatase family protein [Saprospiraceae bacterium]